MGGVEFCHADGLHNIVLRRNLFKIPNLVSCAYRVALRTTI
jgi:hypothetical protein